MKLPYANGKIEKLGFEGIVNIRGVVSNFVDPVDELRFEGGASREGIRQAAEIARRNNRANA